jgi:hypothetical protein
MRMRTDVYPATFACHVPVDVVELAAVVLFDGVTFNATQVVPPLAVASNCSVLLDALALTVNVAPPTEVVIGSARHTFVVAQSEAAAESVAVTRF